MHCNEYIQNTEPTAWCVYVLWQIELL